MKNKYGYLVIENDNNNDNTTLVCDLKILNKISRDKKHWINAHSPFLWVKLCSERKIYVIEAGGVIWGNLSHKPKECWLKGLPTLEILHYESDGERLEVWVSNDSIKSP